MNGTIRHSHVNDAIRHSHVNDVVVVVSHIQRIGCQPGKTTLHGGQSRSWSAEHRKKKKSGGAPPPPRCSFGGKKNHATHLHV